MIQAIIFDFGRVISAQKPPSLFHTYEQQLGIRPGTINRIMFGSPAWQEALLGRITSDDYWRAIAPELNLNTPDAISRFRRQYRADEAINEGVVAIIRKLCGRYKLGVLSNCLPGLAGWLDDWRILDLFDVVLCSGDEGLVKPDPAFFQQMLDRLQVAPEEAIFVDDYPGHVEAAGALGLGAILFTTSEELEDDLAGVLGNQRCGPCVHNC